MALNFLPKLQLSAGILNLHIFFTRCFMLKIIKLHEKNVLIYNSIIDCASLEHVFVHAL